MTAFTQHVDVLVVGAGPSGLTLALALQQRGIRALVVDRQAAGQNTSRAAVIHARTLEVLRDLGVTPELLPRGLQVPVFRVRDRDRLLLEVDFGTLDTDYPFTLMLPQNETEAILLQRLQAAGGEVLRPVELTSLALDAKDGADAVLSSEDGTHHVHAAWVVGCDGSRSAVRQAADIAFQGGNYDETFVLADVSMDTPLARSEVDLFLSQEGLVVLAPLPHGQHRIVATVAKPPKRIDAGFLADLLRRRGPSGTLAIHAVIWSSHFSLQHRVAATQLKGRVLLCGDAAHVHSPAGGQGMNTGIQDAATLAPALGEALASGNRSSLEAWAGRRHRVAEDVVALTDRMTRLATLQSPFARSARNVLLPVLGAMPGIKHRLARRLAELDYR